ncbi:unnamed protein product [Closterium sp. NIES-54]
MVAGRLGGSWAARLLLGGSAATGRLGCSRTARRLQVGSAAAAGRLGWAAARRLLLSGKKKKKKKKKIRRKKKKKKKKKKENTPRGAVRWALEAVPRREPALIPCENNERE